MLDLEQLCVHLRYLLQMSIRRYDGDGNLVGPAADGQPDPLRSDPAFAAQLLELRNPERPVVYHEDENVLYAVIALPEGGALVCGPGCYELRLKEAVRAVRQKHKMSEDVPYRIPLTPADVFGETVLLLFHAVSDRRLVRNDLVILNDEYDRVDVNARRHMEQLFSYFREGEFRHNPYNQEVREQQSIRDGDIERLKKSWQESYEGKIGRLGPDAVRHYRNLSVVNIALSCRSAIEGGVPPEIAYSMADAYTMETEKLSAPGEIVRLFRGAQLDYARLVQQYRSGGGSSPLVGACKELVHRRLHRHITVKELAETLGVSYTYLSNLFSRSEGIPLSAYILREKVLASLHHLLETDLSLDGIASLYGFCSQSHYGQAFRKWMGMTPGEYRSRNRRK